MSLEVLQVVTLAPLLSILVTENLVLQRFVMHGPSIQIYH
jgi:hypothetical protein